MSAGRCLVRVPASSANLGPGFDVLAAALALHLELEVIETGRFALRTELDVRRDRGNLAVRAFERLHPADRFEFRLSSAIPLSGGLGSSAAAIVAGVMAADALRGLGVDVRAAATEIEGHPDNVAAAVCGGFVVCDGDQVHRLAAPSGLAAVLVVPRAPVRTAQARAALPAEVPLGDATFNLAKAAVLVLGLASGNLELVSEGLADRLHQPHRAHLYPRSAELVTRVGELGALGATISGAGPTVLVWARTGEADALRERLGQEVRGWARVIPVAFEPDGASVTVG